MSANVEFEEVAPGSVDNASSATRKRLFLNQATGTFSTKDQAGAVNPVSSTPGAWIHNAVVTNPPFTTGAPYTASVFETVKVDPSGGDIRVVLPTAVGIAGAQVKVVSLSDDISPNLIVVDGNSAETINGDLTRNLNTPRQRITVESDGANWLVVS